MRSRIITAIFLATATFMTPPMASAQLFGGVVFDPTNYGQNVLTAVRTLQTVNNQINQLQNEADMLINDAQNLIQTGFNPEAEIRRLLDEISTLMDQASAISYEMSETDRVFQQNYPEDYTTWSQTEIAAAAEMQWVKARAGYNDTLLMQSRIVESVKSDTNLLGSLLTETMSASGNLNVAQTGNQIMALNAKQTMQMQELMASQFRAEALERARTLQIERAGAVQLERFSGNSSAYVRR